MMMMSIRMKSSEIGEKVNNLVENVCDKVSNDGNVVMLRKTECTEANVNASVERRRDVVTGEFGIGGKGGIDVSGHVDFGYDLDASEPCVAQEMSKLGLGVVEISRSSTDLSGSAVSCEIWPGLDFDPPALVVG